MPEWLWVAGVFWLLVDTTYKILLMWYVYQEHKPRVHVMRMPPRMDA